MLASLATFIHRKSCWATKTWWSRKKRYEGTALRTEFYSTFPSVEPQNLSHHFSLILHWIPLVWLFRWGVRKCEYFYPSSARKQSVYRAFHFHGSTAAQAVRLLFPPQRKSKAFQAKIDFNAKDFFTFEDIEWNSAGDDDLTMGRAKFNAICAYQFTTSFRVSDMTINKESIERTEFNNGKNMKLFHLSDSLLFV